MSAAEVAYLPATTPAIAGMLAVRSPRSPDRIAALACSSAVMNWSAFAGRSSGFLFSPHITTCSSSPGTLGLMIVGGGGASDTCLSAIVTADSASNGTRPVSISYRTTAIEYRSEPALTAWPCACSGDRYWAVPMIEPVSVMSDAPARAIPKSVTLALSASSTITLWGFRSRWMTPRRCANRAALRIWIVMSIARTGSSGASSRINCLSERPGRYSIAM